MCCFRPFVNTTTRINIFSKTYFYVRPLDFWDPAEVSKHTVDKWGCKPLLQIRWSSRGWLEGCPSGMCDKIKPGDQCKDIRYWWVGKCSCPCPEGHHCHEEFCKPIPTTGLTVTTAETTQYQTTNEPTVPTQLPTTTTTTAGATSTLAGTTATTSTTPAQTPQSSTTSISDKMCDEFKDIHRFSSDPKVERWYAKFCL